MTLLHFTFGALPFADAKKGTHIIHAYLHQSEPTRTDSPGDERRAAKDCAQIVGDIILRNINEDEERLLQEGEIPADALPIFTFAIGVAWDREAKMPTYKLMDYATLCDQRKFAPVYALGAELYRYTFGVLKKRERVDRAKVGAAKYSGTTRRWRTGARRSRRFASGLGVVTPRGRSTSGGSTARTCTTATARRPSRAVRATGAGGARR